MDDENTYQEQLVVYAGSTGGPPGPQGRMGLQGFQGILGIGQAGVQGDAGINGLQGVEGNQGWQGLVGLGPPGVQGSQGWQGDLGIGAQGSQGVGGFQGNDGSAGSIGFQGNEGPQGPGVGFLSSYNSVSVSFTSGVGSFTHGLSPYLPTVILVCNGNTALGNEAVGVTSFNTSTCTVRLSATSTGTRTIGFLALL